MHPLAKANSNPECGVKDAASQAAGVNRCAISFCRCNIWQ